MPVPLREQAFFILQSKFLDKSKTEIQTLGSLRQWLWPFISVQRAAVIMPPMPLTVQFRYPVIVEELMLEHDAIGIIAKAFGLYCSAV